MKQFLSEGEDYTNAAFILYKKDVIELLNDKWRWQKEKEAISF